MRFKSWPSRSRYNRFRRNARGLLMRLSVLALVVVLLSGFAARGSLYKTYAYHRIWFSSRFKAWIHFPVEDKIYVGARDFQENYRNTPNVQDPTIGPSPSPLYDPVIVHREGRVKSGSVACDGVRGVDMQLSEYGKALNKSLFSFPEPSIGSYDVLGVDSDVFHTRFSRFGNYGLGDSDALRRPRPSRRPSFAWEKVDWASFQTRCVARNKARFDFRARPITNASQPEDQQYDVDQQTGSKTSLLELAYFRNSRKLKSRTAVVMRAWDEFRWTEDDVTNVRAMITELSLFSGSEYQLFIIVHLRNTSEPLPTNYEANQELKKRYVPKEFFNMTDLWTEKDCEASYPKVKEYDVYNQTFMPLQLFAIKHPEFDFYWNWEMDVRYTGHYYQLLEGLSGWAKNQTRNYLWDRNARFYIPSIHGSYNKFAKSIQTSAEDPPWGPAVPEHGITWTPFSSADFSGRPHTNWGIGEEADLITLFPMFDPKGTLWPYKDHLINFDSRSAKKPRRASIVTVARLSHRLVMTMHNENLKAGRSMMSEMWPATTALHYGLKAVYAPHPIFLDRRWPPHKLQKIFNAGPGGQVGGSLDTVINQEHNFDGATWFWKADFPRDLYQRWKGKANNGEGSPEWEKEHGAMCLPAILFHPVKTAEVEL